MKIRELKKPITDREFIVKVQLGAIKIENAAIIHFNTGTLWTYPVLVQALKGDDLMDVIDWIYDYDSESIRLYDPLEVIEYEFMDEYYLPVNGGEYYTDMIEFVEYI